MILFLVTFAYKGTLPNQVGRERLYVWAHDNIEVTALLERRFGKGRAWVEKIEVYTSGKGMLLAPA